MPAPPAPQREALNGWAPPWNAKTPGERGSSALIVRLGLALTALLIHQEWKISFTRHAYSPALS